MPVLLQNKKLHTPKYWTQWLFTPRLLQSAGSGGNKAHPRWICSLWILEQAVTCVANDNTAKRGLGSTKQGGPLSCFQQGRRLLTPLQVRRNDFFPVREENGYGERKEEGEI